eukprot:UN09005
MWVVKLQLRHPPRHLRCHLAAPELQFQPKKYLLSELDTEQAIASVKVRLAQVQQFSILVKQQRLP